MRNCGLGDESAKNIIKCLSLNKTLLTFNVTENPNITEHLYLHILTNLGNIETSSSDNSSDSGISTKIITKKQLMEEVKFLQDQLDIAIVTKKKSDELYEKMRAQYEDVQKERLIDGAFKIPDGFTLIAREALDDLLAT